MSTFRKLKVERRNVGTAPAVAVADFTWLIQALPRSGVVSFSVQGSVNHWTPAVRMAKHGKNVRLLDAKWPSVQVNRICIVDRSSRLVSVQKVPDILANEVWCGPIQATTVA